MSTLAARRTGVCLHLVRRPDPDSVITASKRLRQIMRVIHIQTYELAFTKILKQQLVLHQNSFSETNRNVKS